MQQKKLGTKVHMGVSKSTSEESRRDVLTAIDWFLYEQLSKCIALPENTMKSILRRAEELITMDNAITTAPVEGTARMVKSISCPHLAQIFQDGKVICDENCRMWTSVGICSHCVAVAHCLDVSGDLVSWFAVNSK